MIKNGDVNVHTMQNPEGEIRGQSVAKCYLGDHYELVTR
jgi:hypothetical protein